MNDHIFELSARHLAKRIVEYFFLIGSLVLGAPWGTCDQPVAKVGGGFSGKVVETMNAGTYTYALLDTGKEKLWMAAPKFEAKVGDSVAVASALAMPKYHSKTLNRDFEVVYFTGSVQVNGVKTGIGGMAGQLPKGHPPIAGSANAPTINLSGIKKAEGGKSIAEIYAAKAELKGKPVKVRGKVVKYNAQIMGKNWMHIQDGTGSDGSNDLVVTTSSEAKRGDTVLVNGTVSTGRDFGAGYKYDVIIEDAKVTVE